MYYKFYTNEEIAQTADEARNNLCRYPELVPIDIENLIEFRMGIQIRPLNFGRTDTQYVGMLTHDLKTIFIDNSLMLNSYNENRLRFTLAHELGHYHLHGSFLKDQKFKSIDDWIEFHLAMEDAELDVYEKNCNEFAGRFLVPLNVLKAELAKLSEIIDLKKKELYARNTSEYTVNEYLRRLVAERISSKFKVATSVIEIRLKREKLL